MSNLITLYLKFGRKTTSLLLNIMQMHAHEVTHIKSFPSRKRCLEKVNNKYKGLEEGTSLQLWAAAESSLAGSGISIESKPLHSAYIENKWKIRQFHFYTYCFLMTIADIHVWPTLHWCTPSPLYRSWCLSELPYLFMAEIWELLLC